MEEGEHSARRREAPVRGGGRHGEGTTADRALEGSVNSIPTPQLRNHEAWEALLLQDRQLHQVPPRDEWGDLRTECEKELKLGSMRPSAITFV